MSYEIKAATVDDKRRVVLPESWKPRSAVTIECIEADTLVIRRQRPRDPLIVVLEPDVKHLPENRELDRLTTAASRSALRHVRNFDAL